MALIEMNTIEEAIAALIVTSVGLAFALQCSLDFLLEYAQLSVGRFHASSRFLFQEQSVNIHCPFELSHLMLMHIVST